jgi:dynein intermediate chain
VVSTNVGSGRAINKLQWDRKDGRRAALGGSDGKLYVYDIGDMAIPERVGVDGYAEDSCGCCGRWTNEWGVDMSEASRIVAGR